jgi:hypothetical protein
VDISKITIEMSETLRDLQAEILQLDGKAIIQLVAPSRAVVGAGISGHLILEDKVAGAYHHSVLNIVARPLARVSPQVVSFRKKKNDSGGESWNASFLVRAVEGNSSTVIEKGTNQENGLITVGFKVDGSVSAVVKQTEINKRTHRVDVVLSSKEEALPDEVNIHWTVRTTFGDVLIGGKGFFEKE